MRKMGPVLQCIEHKLDVIAKNKLRIFLQRATSREIMPHGGAQSFRTTLPDGSCARLTCRQEDQNHCGIDVDLKIGHDGSLDNPVTIREHWNSQLLIEVQVDSPTTSRRKIEVTGKTLGDMVEIPAPYADIAKLPVIFCEERKDYILLQLRAPE